MSSSFSADGNDGLNLGSHITGGLSATSNANGTGPSAFLAWALIIGAVVLLVMLGAGLTKVRI